MTKYIGLKTILIAAFGFPCILCCPVDDTNEPTVGQELSTSNTKKKSFSHLGRG